MVWSRFMIRRKLMMRNRNMMRSKNMMRSWNMMRSCHMMRSWPGIRSKFIMIRIWMMVYRMSWLMVIRWRWWWGERMIRVWFSCMVKRLKMWRKVCTNKTMWSNSMEIRSVYLPKKS